MKIKLPRWIRGLLCAMGIHLKYKWVFGRQECTCGEAEWN